MTCEYSIQCVGSCPPFATYLSIKCLLRNLTTLLIESVHRHYQTICMSSLVLSFHFQTMIWVKAFHSQVFAYKFLLQQPTITVFKQSFICASFSLIASIYTFRRSYFFLNYHQFEIGFKINVNLLVLKRYLHLVDAFLKQVTNIGMKLLIKLIYDIQLELKPFNFCQLDCFAWRAHCCHFEELLVNFKVSFFYYLFLWWTGVYVLWFQAIPI